MEPYLGFALCQPTQTDGALKIYLFSGLGADERLFSSLKPIPGYEYRPVPYIHPGNCQNLSQYAQLLHDEYQLEPGQVFLGVSLGGVIAQELASIIPAHKVVLISSIRSKSEMPLMLKAADRLKIGHILHKPLLETLAGIGDKFTFKTREGRELFFAMLHDTDPDFMHFAVKAILKWSKPGIRTDILRIHGTQDRVFPISKIGSCHKIEKGSHFMVFDRGEEISGILKRQLA
jgi:pimeloyl-ACP methyl ester carboxylesterase